MADSAEYSALEDHVESAETDSHLLRPALTARTSFHAQAK